MSNAVTLAVVVGCGSCFDVVVVSGGVCIADTSGMLGHRVFTSVHARLVHRWLDLPKGLGCNSIVSITKQGRGRSWAGMQPWYDELQTCKCNFFHHWNIAATSQHSQMRQPSSSTVVHKPAYTKFYMQHVALAHHQIKMCVVKHLPRPNFFDQVVVCVMWKIACQTP